MFQFTGKRSRKCLIEEFYLYDSYGFSDFAYDEIDKFYDIGANVGLISLQARMFYRHADIYAFEPCKRTYDIMVDNLAYFNVNCHRLALGNGEPVFLEHEGISSSHAFNNHEKPEEYWDKCESLTINQIFEQFSPPTNSTFVKIDCEGAEEHLVNQDPTMLKQCKRIAMETHGRRIGELVGNWIVENFSDSHEIKSDKPYFRTRVNLILLTKKRSTPDV